MPILNNNPKIEELSVQLISKTVFPKAFWKAIVSSFHSLRTLRIHGAVIVIGTDVENKNHDRSEEEEEEEEDTALDAFLDACLTVEHLDLDFIDFRHGRQLATCPRWTECRVLPNLRHLDFFGRTQLDLEFLSKCLSAPTLQSLRWSTSHKEQYAPGEFTKLVTQRIVEARLAALESLELWDGMPFTDKELAAILDSLANPLKEFSVADSRFGEEALISLLRQPLTSGSHQDLLLLSDNSTKGESPTTTTTTTTTLNPFRQVAHCATLQKLDLSDCQDVTEDMIQQITASCPDLKTFYPPELDCDSSTNAMDCFD
ncbi:hypothetical protein BGZ65_009948 [Modicella reniformis]|uniref:Uncharacterized protein n=1 Tax=Modicella reniformis TaxID=1440133 RepID=A0A9P6MJW4_9FUNG|nr:hypothetical protein BGZ65_009948 [Modicella reniformis]